MHGKWVNAVAIVENLFIGGFWSGMVSYVSLSILKLYSIWKPLSYRQIFTMKRCLHLIALRRTQLIERMKFSWVIFAVIELCALMMYALVEVPVLNEWSGCKYETCIRIAHRIRRSVAPAIYLFTLLVFALTVLLIKRAQKFSNSFKRKDQHSSEKCPRFPLWKLTLNVGTFGGLSFFYVLWCFWLLLHRDQCFFLRNYVEVMRLFGIIR
ncbi:unnamed protein product [Toxocara canis]|uniref:G_PROTEIN_RECEP_F1_2 domain-containing protein n=1 Tax=Toxocara canis TaxID=6265 RepID=A0A183UC54_TOXCA|nr:unnamed protein product [Toxocara canis]